jgi:L-aminopeptidase/D-esterase-like protein
MFCHRCQKNYKGAKTLKKILLFLLMVTIVLVPCIANTTPAKVEVVKFQDIPNISVGNAEAANGFTGATVVLCTKKDGATGGVDVRGGAPGTAETDLLRAENTVQSINAVTLAGGSAFGLEARSGVMRFLEEKGIGFDVGVTHVPIVPSAILFDLSFGDPKVKPDVALGYKAASNAFNHVAWQDGCVGAGAGATVGKFDFVAKHSMKSGLGSYAYKVGDLYVGAIVAVNACGDIIDPMTGKIVAGMLNDDRKTFKNSEQYIVSQAFDAPVKINNTTISVIVTNAKLTKAQCNKIAQLAQDGYARAIRPVHTIWDGDTVFTMATGDVNADMLMVGSLAVEAMERAILNAAKNAKSLNGYPSAKEIGSANN